MDRDRGLAPPARRGAITPLWVIALFLSLAETVLGVAVIQTEGTVQLTLTVFVVAFPTLVAAFFFVILWRKPYHLYAPADFGSLDFVAYIGAMRGGPAEAGKFFEEMKETLTATLASKQTVSEVLETLGANMQSDAKKRVEEVLDNAVTRTVERLKEVGFLAIDTRPLLGEEGDIEYLVFNERRTVSDLLDSIWVNLNTKIGMPSYTYGIRWALREAQTSRLLKEMGRTWARARGMASDSRTFSDVGLKPGMTLEVVPLGAGEDV